MVPPRRRQGLVPIRRDRGAVIPLVAICMVLLIISAALAIDIGRLSVAGRQTRNVADIAALDAVKSLDGISAGNQQQATVEAEVRRSAARNGFVEGQDGTLVTTLGNYDRINRTFTPFVAGLAPDAVRVEAKRPNDNLLVPGSFTVTRSATALRGSSSSAMAGIGIATTTAAVDSSRSAVLNAILGNALGDRSIGLDILSWQTLADFDVTLGELASIGLGLAPSQIQQLLDTTWDMATLLDAIARVLAGTPVGTILSSLVGLGATPLTLTLAQFIEADVTSLDANLLAIGVADLVQAAAMASAKDTIVVNLGLSIPLFSTISASLRIIDPPSYKFGPAVTTFVESAQLQLILDATLLDILDIPLLGTSSVHIPLVVDIGRGKATIAAIGSCSERGEPDQVTVDGEASTASVRIASPDGNGDALLARLLGLPITAKANVVVGQAGPVQGLTFEWPYAWQETQRVSVANGSSSVLAIGSDDLKLLGLQLGDVVGPLLGLLNPALDSLVPPLLHALGADVGIADISVPVATCQSARASGLVQ